MINRIEEIINSDEFPKEDLAYIDSIPDKVIPVMMERLELFLNEPESLFPGEEEFIWVWMFYLASHRVKESEDLILKILARDSDELDYLFGIVLTEEMNFVLREVYSGNIDEYKSLILDESIDFSVRDSLMEVLAFYELVMNNNREAFIEYLKEVSKSVQSNNILTTMIADTCIDYHIEEMEGYIESLYKVDKIDKTMMGDFDEFLEFLYDGHRTPLLENPGFDFMSKVKEYWDVEFDFGDPQDLIHDFINSELSIKEISREIDFKQMLNYFETGEKAILNILVGGDLEQDISEEELDRRILELLPRHFEKQLRVMSVDQVNILLELLYMDYRKLSMIEAKYGEIKYTIPFVTQTGLIIGVDVESDEKICVVPKEIKAILEKDQISIIQKSQKNTYISELVTGMVNLYGVIHLEAAFEILTRLSKEDYDYEEFVGIVTTSIVSTGHVGVSEFYLYHPMLNDYRELLLSENYRDDLDYYSFSKEVLLTNKRFDYIKNTSQVKGISKFFKECYNMGQSDVDLMLSMIKEMINIGANIMEIYKEFTEVIDLDNSLISKNFMDLLIPLYNSMSQWELKGWSPNLLANTSEKKIVKVGRNDPCPCGSGYKYKKCCGK